MYSTTLDLRPRVRRRSDDAGRIPQAPNPPPVAVHGEAGGAEPALDEPGRVGVPVVVRPPLVGVQAGIVVETVVHLHRRGGRGGRRCGWGRRRRWGRGW